MFVICFYIDVCMHDKVLILCLCAYGTPIPPPHIIMIIVGAAPSACFRAKPGFRAADLCNPVGLPPRVHISVKIKIRLKSVVKEDIDLKNSLVTKFLALLVCAIMVAGILPVAAIAESTRGGVSADADAPTPPSSDEWKQIASGGPGYGFKLVDYSSFSLTSGNYYIILDTNRNTNGSATAHALSWESSNGDSISSTSVGTKEVDGSLYVTTGTGEVFSETSSAYVWQYSAGKLKHSGAERYLYYDNSLWGSGLICNTDGNDFNYDNNKGPYLSWTSWFSTYSRYINYSSSESFYGSNNYNNRTYLYERTEYTTPPIYAALSGKTDFVVRNNAYSTTDDILAMVRDNIYVWYSETGDHSDAVLTEDYTFAAAGDSLPQPGTDGTYPVYVRYNGVTIGTINVYVTSAQPDSVTVSPSGRVKLGASGSALVGSTMTMTYSASSISGLSETVTETVPVTFGMVSRTDGFDEVGIYTDCTVTYAGVTYSPFTLEVYSVEYPVYPNPGSVSVNKTGTGIDWYQTGLANVELSAMGIPENRGVDIIVMIDTSSSMDETRMTAVRDSLVNLVAYLNTPNADGTARDVRMAIGDFSDHSTSGIFAYDEGDRFGYDLPITASGSTSSPFTFSTYSQGKIYTGPNACTDGTLTSSSYSAEYREYYTADAFVDVSTLAGRDFSEIAPPNIDGGAGTNYDAGLGAAYMLGNAIRRANEASEDEAMKDRELVVIFMSDGSPYQYNFFTKSYLDSTYTGSSFWGGSAYDWDKASENWRIYLGGDTDSDGGRSVWNLSGSNTLYSNFNGGSYNWYAEAIKGSRSGLYSVIDKSSGKVLVSAAGTTEPLVGDDYMYNVPGLDAKLYTIGFCLANDTNNGMTVANQTYCLQNLLATGDNYYYSADSASDLTNAFLDISGKILVAGKYAYYEDTMGDAYELQLANKTYGGTTYSQAIEVRRYVTVKLSDVGRTMTLDGEPVTITTNDVGRRTGEVEVIERVTFNADGTEAYSSLLGDTTNILGSDGIIRAKYFYYNTNSTAQTITVPALDPGDLETTSQTDYDHPFTTKAYSFSVNPLTYDGWTVEGTATSSGTSYYKWTYSSDGKYMMSLNDTNYSRLVSPVFTVPDAGGLFTVQLINYTSSGGVPGSEITDYAYLYVRDVDAGTITKVRKCTLTMNNTWLMYGFYMKGTAVDGNEYNFNGRNIQVLIERAADSTYGLRADDAFFYGYNFATVTTGATMDYTIKPYTFYWQIGDITEDEIALSYNVYLKDSILPNDQTGVEEGIYPTNESAVLYYKNCYDDNCKQSVPSPELPWGQARVSYAFYYVDENGNPIVNLITGATGNFTNRIAALDPVQYAKFRYETGTSFSADALAESLGFELYDQDAAYAVTAGTKGTDGTWTITKGADKAATTYVTGYSGSDYTTTDNDSTHGWDCSNTTVWFAVVYKVGAVSDAVVLDYGLPVSINVLDNDLLSMVTSKEIVGIGSYYEDMPDQTDAPLSSFSTTKVGNFGTAVVTDATKGFITYTLDNSKSMNFKAPETLAYAVQCKGFDEAGNEEYTYYYARLTIIPAAIVYYEDNFITFTSGESTTVVGENATTTPITWECVGKPVDDPYQSQDRPGASGNPFLDADNAYGYDPAYADCSEYSMGESYCVTVDGNTTTNPTASFTFWGTGFDIISKTSSDSGIMIVEIKNAETNASVDCLIVDTYYGYTYNTGDGTWSPNPTDAAVWQVPVIKRTGLSYGHYRVNIIPVYNEVLDHNSDNQGYTVYIDAVRIYDPVDVSAGTNDANRAANAYALDGEANPDYETVRNFVFNQMSSALEIEGFVGGVFIDGAGEVIYSGNFEYTNPSPNNEIYLAPGQAVYFKLRANVDPTNQRVMIGVKLAFGSSASLTLTQLNSEGREISTDSIAEVTTATDMYYSLGNITWKPVGETTYYETNGLVLTNTGSAGNVISLTNLKISSYDTDVDINFADITAASDVNELLAGDSALIVPCCDSDEAIAAAEYMNYNYGSYTLGDVNGDGEIDMLDTLITLRHTIGLAELWGAKRRAADMDGNGVIDAIDVMHIMRYVMENK